MNNLNKKKNLSVLYHNNEYMELFEPCEDSLDETPRKRRRREGTGPEEGEEGSDPHVLDPDIWGRLPFELVVYILNWRTQITLGKAQERMNRGIIAWAGVVHELKNMAADITLCVRYPRSSYSLGSLRYWAMLSAVPVMRKVRYLWTKMKFEPDYDEDTYPEVQGCVDPQCAVHYSRAEVCAARYSRMPITTEANIHHDEYRVAVMTYAQRRKYGINCLCCGRMRYVALSNAYKKAISNRGWICRLCRMNKCAKKGLFGIHGSLVFE
jgi:hypothetical protein